MIGDTLRMLRRDGLSRLLWIVLLSAPLWLIRLRAPTPYEHIPTAEARLYVVDSRVEDVKLQALALAILAWTALLAHALLAGRMLARHAGRRISRGEMVAITLPAAGIACCHLVWQALLVGALAVTGHVVGVYGALVRDLIVCVGLGAVLHHGAVQLTALVGLYVRRGRAGSAAAVRTTSAARWRLLRLAGLTSVATLYLSVRGLLLRWESHPDSVYVTSDAGPVVLVGLLEAALLTLWLAAGCAAWHRDAGSAPPPDSWSRVFG